MKIIIHSNRLVTYNFRRVNRDMVEEDIFKDPKTIRELIKCARDPIYFVNEYGFIMHPTIGLSPFVAYPHQEKLIKSYHENQLNIVVGARQVGITISTVMYILWYAMFHSDKRILICSDKVSNTQEILDKLRVAYEKLPAFLKLTMKENNKYNMCFENDSGIIAAAPNLCQLKVRSYDLLVLDNVGYSASRSQGYLLEFITIAHEALKSNIILTSTGGLYENTFKDIWEKAVLGINRFIPHYIPWNVNNRDDEFRNSTISMIGEEAWKVEFDCHPLIKEDHNGARKECKPKET